MRLGINQSQRERIEKWIEENPNITIKEVTIRILEEFSVKVGRSRVHREMQKMKFSYITPQPVHYKQDKESQVDCASWHRSKGLKIPQNITTCLLIPSLINNKTN